MQSPTATLRPVPELSIRDTSAPCWEARSHNTHANGLPMLCFPSLSDAASQLLVCPSVVGSGAGHPGPSEGPHRSASRREGMEQNTGRELLIRACHQCIIRLCKFISLDLGSRGKAGLGPSWWVTCCIMVLRVADASPLLYTGIGGT